jgi:hypothetical protein
MSLDIGTALREGTTRTFGRNGLLLIGAFVAVGAASAVVTDTATAELTDSLLESARLQVERGELTAEEIEPLETAIGELSFPFALSIPLPVAVVLWAAVALLAEAISIVAVRAFVREPADALSGSVARRNLPWATANGFLGGIVVAFVVGIGLLFLVVPGLFFLVAFLFLRQEIAVEDKNLVDAMADSWTVTKGHRIELFALYLFVIVVTVVASAVFGAIGGAVDPLVGTALGIAVGGVASVFAVAVLTRAYAQLRTERDAEPESGESDDDPWNDPPSVS